MALELMVPKQCVSVVIHNGKSFLHSAALRRVGAADERVRHVVYIYIYTYIHVHIYVVCCALQPFNFAWDFDNIH